MRHRRGEAVSWSSRAGNVVRMGGCKSLSDVGVWSKERRACGVCSTVRSACRSAGEEGKRGASDSV